MKKTTLITDKRVVCSLALFACLLWGSAYPAIKGGYELLAIDPGDTAGKFLFAGWRFFFAGAVLLVLCQFMRKKPFTVNARDMGRMALFGLAMTALQYTFFYIGLSHTTGVKGSILNGTTTFFSVLFAHFAFRAEHLTKRVILGCLIGFAGVISVNFGQSALDFNLALTGEGFILIAALVQGAANVYGKVISQTIDPFVMTGWQLAIGGAVLIGVGYAMGGALNGFTPASVLLLAYMVLLSAAAFTIVATLLKHNPVSLVTVFQFTVPVFGSGLSAIFLGESLLEWKNLFALALVCVGIWLVTQPGKK